MIKFSLECKYDKSFSFILIKNISLIFSVFILFWCSVTLSRVNSRAFPLVNAEFCCFQGKENTFESEDSLDILDEPKVRDKGDGCLAIFLDVLLVKSESDSDLPFFAALSRMSGVGSINLQHLKYICSV